MDRVCCGAFSIEGQDAGWLGPSRIAALVGAVGNGQVRLYDLGGTETSRIDGNFASVLFGLRTGVFAGTIPLEGDDPTARTYRVWDEGALSAPLLGEPLAWSADGSMLALLAPTNSVKVADEGSLSIVDRSGRQLLAIPNWVASTYQPYVFSPDGHYLAACLQPAQNLRTLPQMHVIDLGSGSVSDNVGNGCLDFGTAWGPDTKLYISDASGPPVVWTPGGITPLDTSFGWATPALNGDLALWSDGTDNSALQVRAGTSIEDYQLPQLHSVTWSPDDATIATISWPAGDASPGLTLIPVTQ